MALGQPPRMFGPMHGEKVRRHQGRVPSSRPDDGDVIVTTYEVHGDRLAIEFMRDWSGGVTAAHMTVEHAAWLEGICREFREAYGKDEGDES